VRADLLLLVTALLWGSALVPGRIAAGHLGTMLYNGVRCLIGAVALLPLVGRRLRNLTRREAWGGTLIGLLLFGAASLQQWGLAFTTAGKAGFVTGLYVILVPLLTALIWRRWPRWNVLAASVVATVGLFLLSKVEGMVLARGDGLELAGAIVWALYIILIGVLAPTAHPLRLAFMQYLTCGMVGAVLGCALEHNSVEGWAVAWWTVIYNGLVSIGIAFTLQIVAQRHAPASDATIIMSLEAVFAALFGWLLLGEQFTEWQLVGCGLMLGGMVLAQIGARSRPAREQQDQAPSWEGSDSGSSCSDTPL
jgi:drug/metabolite transporter (DMT)-like permease